MLSSGRGNCAVANFTYLHICIYVLVVVHILNVRIRIVLWVTSKLVRNLNYLAPNETPSKRTTLHPTLTLTSANQPSIPVFSSLIHPKENYILYLIVILHVGWIGLVVAVGSHRTAAAVEDR